MSADPFANTTTVKNILQHIISPKIVSDGSGGYVTKTDLVNVDKILFDSVGNGTGSAGSPLTQQSGRVTIPLERDRETVYHSGVTSSSIIIATVLQNNSSGARILQVKPTTGQFDILLTGSIGLTGSYVVGWFIASF